jgi:DNA-binding NtrC family response regulator
LCVIAVSDAFRGFWHVLSEDLAVVIDVLGPTDPIAFKPDTVAVILAAGGAERDAVKWLENHRVPAGVAALVVGTDTGRRIAMKLVARGASDYFALPDDLEIFRNAVGAAMNGMPRGGQTPTDAVNAFAGIVGESQAIKQALTRAARLLPHGNARALIIGETGTGKEVLARAIHAGGPRRAAPFVAVNCSAFPEHLIESELFGHERGSFTDAHAAKPGLFEMADTGTLFLDEIGDLPLSLQAKLLRLLEDKEIRRVGGTKPRTVDVRILAATNAHLSERVREKAFREDLFFRLSTVTLKLPPLRERGDDIILIAQAVLKRLAGEHHLPVPAPRLAREHPGAEERRRARALALASWRVERRRAAPPGGAWGGR